MNIRDDHATARIKLIPPSAAFASDVAVVPPFGACQPVTASRVFASQCIVVVVDLSTVSLRHFIFSCEDQMPVVSSFLLLLSVASTPMVS